MTGSATRLLWVAAAGVAVALLGLLLAVVVLLGADSDQTGCATGGSYAPSAEALADIPGNYLQLYQQAAESYGLGGDGWSWLAAVGSIETDHGRLDAPGVTSGENFAGAGGPMQFLAPTWASYGVDGDRDGDVDRYDPRDAIPGAAQYLKASGAPRDWARAVFAYNHAGWYVADVTRRAANYRGAAQANPLPTATASGGQRVADRHTASLPSQPPGPIVHTPAEHQARPLGRWQDDNAVDLAVPAGTNVLAVEAGEILSVTGTATRGYEITLRAGSNRFFYATLASVDVARGDRVRAAQVLGASGETEDAEQLHVAAEHGDPMQLWGSGPGEPSTAPLGGCDAGASGPANLSEARIVRTPRAFALLPAWAMAGARPRTQLDARIVPDALWLFRTCGLRVTAGRETGHQSHGDGTALDLVPADTSGGQAAWDDSALRCAQTIGWTAACGASGVAPACPLKPWVRFVGYNGYPGHGDPAHVGDDAHLHISWLASSPPSPSLAGPLEWVRAFPVPSAVEAGT